MLKQKLPPENIMKGFKSPILFTSLGSHKEKAQPHMFPISSTSYNNLNNEYKEHRL